MEKTSQLLIVSVDSDLPVSCSHSESRPRRLSFSWCFLTSDMSTAQCGKEESTFDCISVW